MPDTDPAAPPPRPWTVTAAGFAALGACAVVATYLVVMLGTALVGESSGTPGFAWVATAFLVWALAAGAIAWRTLGGSSWARWVLLVSALFSGSFALTASAFVAAAFIPLLACVTTVCLLVSGSARAWFRAQPG